MTVMAPAAEVVAGAARAVAIVKWKEKKGKKKRKRREKKIKKNQFLHRNSTSQNFSITFIIKDNKILYKYPKNSPSKRVLVLDDKQFRSET